MVAQTSDIPTNPCPLGARQTLPELDAEVLALLSQVGDSGTNAAAQIGGMVTLPEALADLVRAMSMKALEGICGMDRTTVSALAAALELCRRLLLEPSEAPLQVRSPRDVGPRLVVEMGDLEQECLRVVLLDTKHHILAIQTVYQGSVNRVSIRVGEVFREAVRQNATAVIVVHNHPSGDPTPSPEDVAVTRTLIEAGMLIDIEVLDHLVVSHRSYVSLRESGLGFSTR